jgi:hypothetical protein
VLVGPSSCGGCKHLTVLVETIFYPVNLLTSLTQTSYALLFRMSLNSPDVSDACDGSIHAFRHGIVLESSTLLNQVKSASCELSSPIRRGK